MASILSLPQCVKRAVIHHSPVSVSCCLSPGVLRSVWIIIIIIKNVIIIVVIIINITIIFINILLRINLYGTIPTHGQQLTRKILWRLTQSKQVLSTQWDRMPGQQDIVWGNRNSSPKSPEGRFKNYHISRHVHQNDIHYGQLWFHFQSIKAIHSYILHRAIQNSENWPQTLVFESGNASLVGFCSSPPEKPNWGVAHFHLLYQVLACRLWR